MSLSDSEKILRALNRIARALEEHTEVAQYFAGRAIEDDLASEQAGKQFNEHMMFAQYEEENGWS